MVPVTGRSSDDFFLETHLPTGVLFFELSFQGCEIFSFHNCSRMRLLFSNDAGDSLPIDVAAWCKLVSSIESWLGLRRACDLGHSACNILSFVLFGCCTSRQAFG